MSISGKLRWINIWLSLSWLKKSLTNRVVLSEELKKRYNVPVNNINRVDYLLDICSGKRVLHVGFSDYPYTQQKIKSGNLLHLELKKVTKDLLGLDNDKASLDLYRSITSDTQVIEGDIMNGQLGDSLPRNFEIVLLGEILEHLKNPHQAVENLHNNFSAGTILVVTTPNYSSLGYFSAALHNTEMIHPDHYWYFSPITVLKIFPADKFELVDFNFGMYFQKSKKINFVLRRFPFLGECIIAVLKTKK